MTNIGFINAGFIRQVGIRRYLTRYFVRQLTKRLLRRDILMHLPTGSLIFLPRDSQSATEVYVTNANTDWGSEALFAEFADHTRDFIDIGAHIGYYSAYLSPLIRRAYAFEPDPRNMPGLKTNADMARNVEIIRMAVSSYSGAGQLNVGGNSATNTLEPSYGETLNMDVDVTSIDDFAASNPVLDPALIKTDVEGHDLEALLGMKETVARCQPLILSECLVSKELLDLCAGWRYLAFAFTRDPVTIKLQFRLLSSMEDAHAHWCKMIFLVPPRLAATFFNRLD